MPVKLPTSRAARAGIGAGAVVVLAAAGIAGGLLLTPEEEGPEPGPGDRYADPPGCDLVASALPDDAVSGGVLDTDALRPLSDGTARNCTWTTVDDSDTAPRWLQVDLQVYFGAAESAGADLAARRVEDMRTEHADDRDDIGPSGLLRPDGEGAAEAAFHRDNLLVRVWYGGTSEPDGAPLDAEEAAETAAAVARALDESV